MSNYDWISSSVSLVNACDDNVMLIMNDVHFIDLMSLRHWSFNDSSLYEDRCHIFISVELPSQTSKLFSLAEYSYETH